MPSSLHTEWQPRNSDAQPTIDRVNALLDRFDVDAIESIWNSDPLTDSSPSVPAAPPRRPAPDLDEQALQEERALADAFSNRYLLPLFDPPRDAPLPIDPAVAERLDVSYCREHQIAPLAAEAQTLEVAIAFPESLRLADDFQRRSGKQFRPLFAPQSVIERILQLLYPKDEANPSSAARRPAAITKPSPVKETQQQLIHALLTTALNRKATAVHLDRIGELSEVRFRIDGRLRVWKKIPSTQLAETVLGLKLRAKVETGDANSPRSGSFQIRRGAQRVRVRLDACPTIDGERTVLHFKDTANELCGIDQIGFDHRQQLELRSWLSQPPGLILVSGPAGQGTTTTLYSLLSETERPEASIATVESKVERRLQRIQQLQTMENGDMTFPGGLRALLKQDLDVIMVGELRSAEMVDLCIQACAAGSTVLAGLPAQDPLALVRRMLAWGVDRAGLAAALRGTVFQRMLRKLCCRCRKPQTLDRSQQQRHGIPLDCTLYQPVGCGHCRGRGYSGRLAVFELFGRDSAWLRLLAGNAPLKRFSELQTPFGSNEVSLAVMQRVIRGETTLAEVIRLTGGGNSPTNGRLR